MREDNLKEKNISKEIGTILFKVGLSGIKAFVFALSQIVWLMAGIFILIISLKNLTQYPDATNQLLQITSFFGKNWFLFFGSLFAFDWIINFREINKE